jgi:hypothetical protein
MSHISIGTTRFLSIENPAYINQINKIGKLIKGSGRPYNLELKELDASRIAGLNNLAIPPDTFSLHLQYKGTNRSHSAATLNLVNREDVRSLTDISSPVFKIFNYLGAGKISAISVHAGFSSLNKEKTLSSVANALERILKSYERFYKGTISIENLDYNSGGAYEWTWEPANFYSLLENKKVTAVYDIGHAIVTSHRRDPKRKGFSAQSFALGLISRPGKLREIHINAPAFENGHWYDSHLPFYTMPEAIDILRSILRYRALMKDQKPLLLNIEPSSIIAEKNPEEITSQVKCLIELVDRFDK